MVCLALELAGPWLVLGFSVGMEAFDELLSINVSWIQEFSDVLRIWTYASLLLVFSLIFTVVSRLLLLYSTVDKTSPFEDNGLLFWVPDVLCQHSELFCGIYSAFKCSFDEFVGEKVVSLSYSSTILRPPPISTFIIIINK